MSRIKELRASLDKKLDALEHQALALEAQLTQTKDHHSPSPLYSESKGSALVSIHPFSSPRLPLPTTMPLASLHLTRVRT